MNNSKTPKIVIGVGLAAVYAAGLGYFTLRGEHDNAIAQMPTAPAAQIAAEPVAPPDTVPESADSSIGVADPAATAPAAQPAAAPPPVVSAATKAEASAGTGQSDASLRSKEQRIASVTTAAPVAAAPVEETGVKKSSPSSEITSAVSESTTAAGDAPSVVEASASSGNDSQITADVKSQIAAVAPAGAIDVTTRDGVVELTGSVPSEEVIDRARLAARNVADVREVDVSALRVAN